MTDEQHFIVAVLVKYALRQPLDAAEEYALAKWRSRSAEHDALPDQFRDSRWLEEQRRQLDAPPTEEMWEEILRYVDESGEPAPISVLPNRRRRIGWRLAVAGMVAVLVVGGLLLRRGPHVPAEAVTVIFERPVVLPANFNAVLELSDGRMIGLDTVKLGAEPEGTGLKKVDSNGYVYGGGAPTIQRLSIAPNGKPIRIQWTDGSKAWLAGGTSLAYSTDLRGAEVKLTGETWFRVTHDANRPVTIRTVNGLLTRVLGTSFDIRASAGSPEWVALFSGALRVQKGETSVLLRPGKQVEVDDGVLNLSPVADSNAELAWLRPSGKGKWIDFHNADLLTMLPEIASWWRVTVVNPKNLPGVAISGVFRRSGPLETIVKQLKTEEDGHVELTLKDDTIYVSPLRPGRQMPDQP